MELIVPRIPRLVSGVSLRTIRNLIVSLSTHHCTPSARSIRGESENSRFTIDDARHSVFNCFLIIRNKLRQMKPSSYTHALDVFNQLFGGSSTIHRFEQVMNIKIPSYCLAGFGSVFVLEIVSSFLKCIVAASPR